MKNIATMNHSGPPAHNHNPASGITMMAKGMPAIGRRPHRSTKYSAGIDPATMRPMMTVSTIKPVGPSPEIEKPDRIAGRKVSSAESGGTTAGDNALQLT